MSSTREMDVRGIQHFCGMRTIAHIISVALHPLFILTYMLLLLLFVNPFMFGYSNMKEADVLIVMVFLTSAFIPLIAVAMMKGLGWIESLQMNDKQERIGPYIVTGVLYLSLYMHMTNTNIFPLMYQSGTLGAIIALFAGFFVNNFEKVSIHALAMGGLMTFSLLATTKYATATVDIAWLGFGPEVLSTRLLVYAVMILTGAVCTSRLLLKRHNPRNIYTGLILGALGQFIAITILI